MQEYVLQNAVLLTDAAIVKLAVSMDAHTDALIWVILVIFY